MTHPTLAQLFTLVDRTGHCLTPEETDRLRAGIHRLRAEADRLAAERDMLGRETDRLRTDWVEIRNRAERAEAEVARVRALHQPGEGLGYNDDESSDEYGSYGHIAQACTTCGTQDEYAIRWPCPTIRALDPHQAQEQP